MLGPVGLIWGCVEGCVWPCWALRGLDYLHFGLFGAVLGETMAILDWSWAVWGCMGSMLGAMFGHAGAMLGSLACSKAMLGHLFGTQGFKAAF